LHALLVRGSRDFASVDAWQAFVDETLHKANANRGRRVAEDLAAMRELDVAKLPEYVEDDVQVSEPGGVMRLVAFHCHGA
jgi:hypothetical protein